MNPSSQSAQETSSSSVLRALRTTTETAHRRLEARHALSAAEFTRGDYENVMRAYYGFYSALEQRLAPFAKTMVSLDWGSRVKSRFLETDLIRLGYSLEAIDALPRCVTLPYIDCVADALGCLYVLEGSTLGGQVLRRRVQKCIGLEPHTGVAFLHAYGDRTGDMWRRFIECLNLVQCNEEMARACDAALSTFEGFQAWLCACCALRPSEEHDA